MIRKYGCLKDKPDPRDHLMAAPLNASALPERASLRQHVKHVLDQGPSSSCVANAYAQAITICEDMAGLEYDLPSRLYVYSCARALTGDERYDGGTQMRGGAKALQVMGAPPEAAWPFDLSKVNEVPGLRPHMQAHPRRGGTYTRLAGTGDTLIAQCKASIADGYPFVFGTLVGEQFWNATGRDMMTRPLPSEQMGGGHALTAVAYDPEGITVVNSWGDAWADQGFVRMSWDYITWSESYDFWVVRSWQRIKDARARQELMA